ncbi:MAG: amidohydrolase family protein [Ahniella sp.]|nr:amidohydrolase family protein [Ahniella sp.]
MRAQPVRAFGSLAVLMAGLLPAAQAAEVLCGRLLDPARGVLEGPFRLVHEQGRFTVVEKVAAGEPATGTTDLRQSTCLPGFIDLHVHLAGEQGKDSYSEGFRLNPADFAIRSTVFASRTVRAGFTTVRDLGASDGVAISLRNAINQGWVQGPRIFAAGKSIASTGGHADPRNGINQNLLQALGYPGPEQGVVDSVDEARKAVRSRYKEGADVVKITATGGVLSYAKSADNPQFTIEEVEAVVATAKDYGMHVAAHAHGNEGARRAIMGGVRTIEHGSYLDERTMRLMKEKGTVLVPTLSAGAYASDKAKIDGWFPEIIRPKAIEVGTRIKETFGRAYKMGVPFAFGTDSGVSAHGDNAREFELMVEVGVSPLDAIRAATTSAAKVLDQQNQLGQIAPGFHADLVAVSGDPLQDIKILKTPTHVLKSGVWVRADP